MLLAYQTKMVNIKCGRICVQTVHAHAVFLATTYADNTEITKTCYELDSRKTKFADQFWPWSSPSNKNGDFPMQGANIFFRGPLVRQNFTRS